MSTQDRQSHKLGQYVSPSPPIVEHDFLGDTLRTKVASLLASEDLQWLSGDESTHAASGSMYQLATPQEHDRLPMQMVSELLLAAVLRRTESLWPFASPSLIAPQVYPIRTVGRRHNPPFHFPHRQGQQLPNRRISPRGTALYFAEAQGALGGDIVGIQQKSDGSLVDTFELEPEPDRLILLDSHQVYRVAPMHAGTSTVVVVNLYDCRDLTMSRLLN